MTVLSLGHVKSCVNFVKSAGLARESLEVNVAGKMFPFRDGNSKKRNSLVLCVGKSPYFSVNSNLQTNFFDKHFQRFDKTPSSVVETIECVKKI